MDENTPKNNLNNISKLYENLNYFDQYGGSFILFIIITFVFIVAVAYCLIMINSQPIIDDWQNNRCKPYIIPIAGFITHPEGVTAGEYTAENFTYCTQNILSSIAGIALEPVQFTLQGLQGTMGQATEDLNNIRGMFDKVRSFFQNTVQEIMGRIMNTMVPLQLVIITMKDVMGKIQGILTGALFTSLGSYYTLQSLMGAIAQFIITILIALAALIAGFWAVPFTWGAAIANTAIFVAISIPMAIILAFMIDVLKVKTSLKVPKVKCFDKNTLILMDNGKYKPICEIAVGDMLDSQNKVTAVMKVETNGSTMYTLNGVIVSDTHMVKYRNKWIRVAVHPNSVKYPGNYEEKYLYCVNTTSKTIPINGTLFSDWDEVFNEDILYVKNNMIKPFSDTKDLHKYLDGGFDEDTKIELLSGMSKKISDINVGDVLKNGEKIYGVVEILAKDLDKIYNYSLGSNKFIGGPNIGICDRIIDVYSTLSLGIGEHKKVIENYSKTKLYHLITNKKYFYIGNMRFYDYDAGIDLFLENKKIKLLSMKYV